MQPAKSISTSTGISRLLKSPLMEHIKVFKMEKVKKMSEDFKHKLGGGGFSSVFKGHCGHFPVVIKKYMTEESKGFDTEVLNLYRGRHPNVVKLLGVSVDEEPCVILEYAEHGSLDDYLKKKTKIKLNKIEKIKIFIELSNTLMYLHKRHVVHRDIKPGNILLCKNKQAKYADFNIARHYEEEEREKSAVTTTKSMATPDYTCPVWLYSRQCGKFTDIYSLGLTMLVVMSGNKRPHIIINEAEKIIDYGKRERFKNFFVDEWKEEVAIKILEIGYACLRFDKKKRPSARKLSKKLREILKEVIEDNEEEESAEERITKLEIRNRQLYKKRNKLKESIDKIKKDSIEIEEEIQEIKSYLENQRDYQKSLVKKVVDAKKEKKAFVLKVKQYERLIVENKVLSRSDTPKSSYYNQRKEYAVLYANVEKETMWRTSVEEKGMRDCFLSSMIKVPDRDGMYICFDIKWLIQNFHVLTDICNLIYLCNIEEIELLRSIIFFGNKIKLISDEKTYLKLSKNAKIIMSGDSRVTFEGINIVGCDYGDLNAIAMNEKSRFEWRRSEVKGNEGKHAIIRMVGEETRLQLEDVNFGGNRSTETLPIIINAMGEAEGKIKINKCKFINHNRISNSVKKERYYNPILIRSKTKELRIENSCFHNNIIEIESKNVSYVLIYHRRSSESKRESSNVDIINTEFINCNRSSNFRYIDKINIKNCLFFKNKSNIGNYTLGGSLGIQNCNDVILEETDFKKNYSSDNGGAVYFNLNAKIILKKCNFEENYSEEDGGAIFIWGYGYDNSDCKIKECHFKNNDCHGRMYGGYDIYNLDAKIISDERCTFTSEILTCSNISIYNRDNGTFNGFQDNIIFKIR